MRRCGAAGAGRWLAALLALATAGCPQTADEYLAGIGGDPEADAAVDAGPDAAAPVGPRFLQARRIPIDGVAEPRGLAVADGRVFTTDRADDRLVALDPRTGAVVSATPLPARGARALAWLEGALYVGYADRLFRVRDGEATLLADDLDDLVGLGVSDDGLVTAEARRLFVRVGARMAPLFEVTLDRDAGPLARFGSDYLMYAESPRLDGATFSVRLDVLDALSPSRAERRGTVELPVDVGRVTGLAADGGFLYLVGAGYGGDVGQLVEIALAPEPGR